MRLFVNLTLVITFFHLISCSSVGETKASKPNILLIVADDLGYADLGCYGSDIQTPNIDLLASEGLRFSQFYSMPSCAPSRAAFLTGTDNHVAGVGSQFHRPGDEWGYEGYLTDRVATVPEILQENGYNTYMAGKWHLGDKKPEHLPHKRGFQRSFIMHQGAGAHYSDVGFESEDRPSTYSLNGEKATWPIGAYSTDLYTDYLMDFIREDIDDNEPFFAYAAYTSPHWPLQVDSSYWIKYENLYQDGYEALREKNLENLKKAGMIDKDHPLPKLVEGITPWDSLSENQKKREIRKMALYAGMVENLDHNIGRLMKYLKENDLYKNTMIIFMSDNGAAFRDFYNGHYADFLQSSYDNSYENMGSPTSFVSYGPQWAEAGTAPWRYLKQYAYEGGIRTPMIARFPEIKNKGSIHRNTVRLTDLAPTFYEAARVRYPKRYKGNKIYPLQGKSLLPIFKGDEDAVYSSGDLLSLEHHHHVMVRKGEWKLVNGSQNWDTQEFELYNLQDDPAEIEDLKSEYPKIFAELLDEWEKLREDYKLRPKP